MGALNGTLLLIYADGVAVAAQKGCTINYDVDLPDATSKDSGGWAEHINGLRNASIDFDALFSTTGLSASELMAYITSRSKLLLVISGGLSYPLIGQVSLKSLKIDAPMEGTMSLSGSLVVDGCLWQLKGDSAQLITDPDANGTDYDTLTISGTAITSGINLASTAYTNSNTLDVTDEDVIKAATFLTLNSGEAPSIGIWDNTSAFISNEEELAEGLNLITLTVTGTDSSASLRIFNTGAANFALSTIYAWKV